MLDGLHLKCGYPRCYLKVEGALKCYKYFICSPGDMRTGIGVVVRYGDRWVVCSDLQICLLRIFKNASRSLTCLNRDPEGLLVCFPANRACES